jgi:hypothetical protein
MKRSIKSNAAASLNETLRNVDLRNVSLIDMSPIHAEQGIARRVRRAANRVATFIVSCADVGFTKEGAMVFIAGVVFAIGILPHH